MLPNKVDIKTRLTTRVGLNIPILSAAMDTVTESRLAIEMNKLGGIGVIHKNLSIEDQVAECLKVQNHTSGDKSILKSFPNALLDSDNHPITGAAIGIDDLSFKRSQ